MPWNLNNVWEGQTAFILGGGPSLMDVDLTPIHDRCVIGVNNAFFLGDWVDICWFGDLKWYRWHKEKLKSLSHRIIAHCNKRDDMQKIPWLHSMRREKPQGIETRPGCISWNECSGLSAINLAYHLGANPIVLLGFDMRVIGNKKNYHDEHVKMGDPLTAEKAGERYKIYLKQCQPIENDAQKLGVKIINCTPGSAIEVWPIMSLQKYLESEGLSPLVIKCVEACKRKDWDTYRNAYRNKQFSFAELKKFNSEIYPLWKDIPRFQFKQLLACFGEIEKYVGQGKLPLRVVELGCGKGVFASGVLSYFPMSYSISTWKGYDINPLMKGGNTCTDSRYELNILEKPFVQMEFAEEDKQLLVSLHTLEHFTQDEVIEILKMGFQNLIIEVPLFDEDYFWVRGGSTHVLDKGWTWFLKVSYDLGYKIVYEYKKGKVRVGAFVKC